MTWLSALLLLLASVIRPVSARCPSHWYLGEGVRLTGAFSCVFLAAERWCGHRDESVDGPSVESRVYCTGGTSPVVVGGIAVGCQRGGYP